MDKKGAITLTGIAIVFVELIMFVAFLPTINEFIQTALPYLAGNSIAIWLIQLLPMTLVLAITFGVFNKGSGQR